MTTVENKEQAVEMTTEEWLAIRKEAGLKINPDTAKVFWHYAQVLDPYGILPNVPEEGYCVGREYFARSPESEVWVWFGDLPEATRTALLQKNETIEDDFLAALFDDDVPLDDDVPF
jgi:hypothetical protein